MRVIEIAGAVASISAWVVAVYFQWQGALEVRRNLAIATGAVFLLLTVLAHWRGAAKRGLATVSGTVELSDRKDEVFEVFFPEAFEQTPNLALKAISGSVELTVLEQRPDGFRFKRGSSVTSGSQGLIVEWTARGVLER